MARIKFMFDLKLILGDKFLTTDSKEIIMVEIVHK